MSTPAQVTEAHRKLATRLSTFAWQREHMAQLIADSEAAAIKEAATRLQEAFHAPVVAERDKLRAEVERLTECNRISTQSSISLAKQRDEAERSLSEMIKQSRVDSSVAGIAICNEMGAIARAERAEAELAKLRSFYDQIVAECGHDLIVREYRQRGELLRDEANRRKEAEAELAKERAKRTALRQAVLFVLCDHKGKACFSGTSNDRAIIDDAMKEDA